MVKSASLVRTGLTEEMVDQLSDYEASDLPESWKAALCFSEHLSGSPKGPLSDELHGRLSDHFSDVEILRLGALLSAGSGWQRMIEAFGIRPDHYQTGQSGPWAK